MNINGNDMLAVICVRALYESQRESNCVAISLLGLRRVKHARRGVGSQ